MKSVGFASFPLLALCGCAPLLVAGCGGSGGTAADAGMAGSAGAAGSGGGGGLGQAGTTGSGGAAGSGSGGGGGPGQAGTTGSGGAAGSGSGGGGGHAGAPWSPTTVTLERRGALGFCISPGQIVRAEIVPEQGGMIISGAIHRGWDETLSCPGNRCELTEPLGPTPLSAEQRVQLGELVAALPVGECVTGPSPVCDPCLVSEVTVGGMRFVDEPCSAELCPGYFEALHALEAFFDRFVPECARALPLACGDRLAHSTVAQGRANLWSGYGRTARAESGRETLYAFSAPNQCQVVATLKDLGTTDLDLLHLSACDPIGANTVASSTPLDLQTSETVRWTSEPGRVTYVVVDGYAGAEGSYTLEVDCTCP